MIAQCSTYVKQKKGNKKIGSKLPQFVIRTEKENIEKIKYIADKESRSTTQEIVHLIKKRIEAYESIHGEIKIDENNK